MNLSDFERRISRKIVERGKLYFEEGYICDIQHSGDWYEVVVEGTHLYYVEIMLEGQRVVESSCTCPYDFGEYCKHEVAALFAIRDMVETAPNLNELEVVLQSYDKDDLIHLIKMLADEVSQAGVWLTQKLVIEESPHAYHELLKQHLTRKETIDVVETLMEEINQKTAEQQWGVAIELSLILLALVNKVNDVDGEIEEIVTCVLSELRVVCEGSELFDTTAEKETNFQKLLQFNAEFLIVEWECAFFEALLMLYTPLNSAQLAQKIAKHKQAHQQNSYAVELFEKLEFKLLQLGGNSQTIEQFIAEHKASDWLLEVLIQQALERQDFAKALSYLPEDVRLTNRWVATTVNIYRRSGNRAALQEVLYSLLEEGQLIYYEEWKKLQPTEAWAQKSTQLFEHLDDIATDYMQYEELLLKEQQWERLMCYYEKYPYNSWKYFKELYDYDRVRAQNIYEGFVEQQLATSNERRQYKKVCQFIADYKKYVPKEVLQTFTQKLARQYDKRTAFLDELSKI